MGCWRLGGLVHFHIVTYTCVLSRWTIYLSIDITHPNPHTHTHAHPHPHFSSRISPFLTAKRIRPNVYVSYWYANPELETLNGPFIVSTFKKLFHMYQILCNLENFKGWSYFDNFDCHPYKFSRWPNTTRSMCSNVSLWEKKINLFSQQATVSLHFLNSMECLYSFALAITY